MKSTWKKLSLFLLLGNLFIACVPVDSRPTDLEKLNEEESSEVDTKKTYPSVSCNSRGNISNNQNAFEVKTGIDEIEKGKFYVTYSVLGQKMSDNSLRAVETANTYVIKGLTLENKTKVFIYGTGYGDPGGDITQFRNGVNDSLTPTSELISNVDNIIQECMGIRKNETEIEYFSPHNHIDHFNPEFFEEIVNIGYSVESMKLFSHINDFPLITGYNNKPGVGAWVSDIFNTIQSIGSVNDSCNTEVMTFESVIGQWSVRSYPGHTPGTLNLILNSKYHLTGSPIMCEPYEGSENFLHVHSAVLKGVTTPKVILNNVRTSGFTERDHDHDH